MKKSRRRGYTLIEAIIALFISALVTSGLVTFFLFSQNVTHATVQQVRSKQDGYGLVEKLAMELREATLVQIYEEGDVLDITNIDGVTSRVYFDPGMDGNALTPEDNSIRWIGDITLSGEEVVARSVARAGSEPVFNRVNNHIIILLRLGDALDSEMMERVSGPGQQGYEIQTSVFLRNA